jgi:predicted transposase YdaD
LSAMVHGSERFDVLDALCDGVLYDIDDERARLYSDVVLAVLRTEHARSYLEAQMIAEKYEYQSSFAKKFIAEGEARGEVRGEARGLERGLERGLARGLERGLARGEVNAILTVLDARGIAITDEARARIENCSDLVQLEKWIRLAAIAQSVDELFD